MYNTCFTSAVMRPAVDYSRTSYITIKGLIEDGLASLFQHHMQKLKLNQFRLQRDTTLE